MKMTGLRREHFPNGETFSQRTLNQYISARSQTNREFFTRYLLSLIGGMVLGFVFLLITTGTLQIFLVLLSVIAGAFIGIKLTNKSMTNLRELSIKLGMSRSNMRIAKNHLKNGTVAWGEVPKKIVS